MEDGTTLPPSEPRTFSPDPDLPLGTLAVFRTVMAKPSQHQTRLEEDLRAMLQAPPHKVRH